jgi:hypothetical protein
MIFDIKAEPFAQCSNGAILFAGCVAGVEGEGKDVETGMYPQVATTDSSAGGASTDSKPERHPRIISRERTHRTQKEKAKNFIAETQRKTKKRREGKKMGARRCPTRTGVLPARGKN